MALRGKSTAAIAAVAALAAVAGATAWAVSAPAAEPAVQDFDRTLQVPAGPGADPGETVGIDTTLFLPEGPEDARYPAVLIGHGLGGTKDDTAEEARELAAGGYAVLTWSARGSGGSFDPDHGLIGLNDPDHEVADVRALIDWLAARPYVRLDGPGDPRVGISGASYGGAVALQAAGYDERVDAIVPQMTYFDLADALFPNAGPGGPAEGVFQRRWAGVLFGAGGLDGPSPLAGPAEGEDADPGPGAAPPEPPPPTAEDMAPPTAGELAAIGEGIRCGSFRSDICALYQDVAEDGAATGAQLDLLREHSPAAVADRIAVPTLVMQGLNDSLFPLTHADAIAEAVQANGAPVEVVWFEGGHDGGDGEDELRRARAREWFDRWLAEPAPSGELAAPATGEPGGPGDSADDAAHGAGQGFTVTRYAGPVASRPGPQGGGGQAAPGALQHVSTAEYTGLGGDTRRTVGLLPSPPQPVTTPIGGVPESVSVMPGAGGGLGALGGAAAGGLAVDPPGQAAYLSSEPLGADLAVTGSPSMRISVIGEGEVTLFAKVYDVGPQGVPVLPHQLVAPLTVTATPEGTEVDVRLPAMDYTFAEGHTLAFVVSTTDMAYHVPERDGAVAIAAADVGVEMPVREGLAAPETPLAWWVPVLPLAALALAALLLLTGRRRVRPGPPEPALADVPLVITDLTKRYRDGHLAVDGLSLRVERGQVLGLLGPNGAGKTTTLRMLMGLITPDGGEIRIFGRRVVPGTPALSRLGSFVEGPGFLPHLSGRANLELYWRATGRPAADAHLEEAAAIADLGAALRRPVRSYSQGMRQRLAIAQAMLGLPDLLVLDEPTNGLDPPQIHRMREVLARYARGGRTVIVSSHLLAEVEQVCTHVVVMDRGAKVAEGPVREIVGGAGTVAVGTPEPERARAALAGLPGVAAVEDGPDGLVVTLDGASTADAVAALAAHGVPVERVMPHRRLEDAFLSLIGERA
ncbi:alpha/beta fold hydrolase [Allonocardiopsis opalescens]|uniref:ABC-2 type transport system ATP-binding protein n=1 Tax=Allonocardiopsis opalescens TaxID=1144618 RepID=A0A2T0QDC6_9ACTN|nr:alpha/beta fold hydrolase [Allonocardiopsis opalescens]PRY01908.1 ABC-2 type transport system ATP-binding protein [Allonocardiopsis opalescens]